MIKHLVNRLQGHIFLDPIMNGLASEAAEAISLLVAERDALRAFAQKILASWPEGDIDGSEVQDRAIEFGLLKLKAPIPTEPCGEDCRCMEYYSTYEFTKGEVICYERTPLLTGETA